MASEKLRKYLAYYQKVLREDPENIEARLRLAAIFREMGRINHAVEEYSTASKLLARDGLPLEAIAACKAVLELDPTHTESQFFLAKLYALMPGNAARIAQPLASPAQQSSTTAVPRSMRDFESDELDNAVSMIELVQPKAKVAPSPVAAPAPSPHDEATRRGVVDPDENTLRASLEEATESFNADDVPPTGPMILPDERELTLELSAVSRKGDLYDTIDLQPEDILDESEPPRERMETRRVPTSYTRDVIAASEPTETIRLGVFDMDSLELGDEDFDIELDEVEDFHDSEAVWSHADPAIVQVDRRGLPAIPLFSQVSAETFMRIVQALEIRRFPAGQTILSPDSTRRSLFVIVRGTTAVWRDVDGQRIALDEMGEGEFFGEFRLLTGRDGMATVSAKTEVELLELSDAHISTIGESSPEVWDVLWDFYYKRMLNNLLASHSLFRPLDAASRRQLAARFGQLEVLQGEYLLRAGQPCHYLYLVMTGEIWAERDLGGLGQTLAELREGEFFGVASALGDDAYPADLRAIRDTVLFALPSEDFRAVVDDNPEVAREVQREMRKRRALNSQFSSGVTNYAELGVAARTEE